MSRLTVVSVAYPLAPVRSDTAGGAEQVLAQIDRALIAEGHSSVVVASEGSDVAGELIATPPPPALLEERARTAAQRATAVAMDKALRLFPVDIVHLHGLDFYEYLPPPGPAALVTLHLPLGWYPAHALRPKRPNTFLHCVSRRQHRSAPDSVSFLQPIENGVEIQDCAHPVGKRNFAIFLGRICPAKGVHLAIEAAALAGIPLLIAGHVFGYEVHRKYFEETIAPRLSRNCRFVGALGLRQKQRLLGMARCVLVPSLAEETSSLVAREALAAGTPVVAFPRGALADIVENGRTGFLVDSPRDMAAAILRAGRIDPAFCRAEAKRRFPVERMLKQYLHLYHSLATASPTRLSA